MLRCSEFEIRHIIEQVSLQRPTNTINELASWNSRVVDLSILSNWLCTDLVTLSSIEQYRANYPMIHFCEALSFGTSGREWEDLFRVSWRDLLSVVIALFVLDFLILWLQFLVTSSLQLKRRCSVKINQNRLVACRCCVFSSDLHCFKLLL